MKDKRKLKLKKFYFHPITVFIFLTLLVIILSGILSALQIQATYNTVNSNTRELEPTIVAVESLLGYDGVKFLISNALKNFVSFAPLGMLIISLIGITVAEGTGLIETFTKRYLSIMPNFIITFIIIFLATISSLINEIGYAILIPLSALIFFINKRNPITGIVTAFCGVSFGYGVSLFVGSMEVSLNEYTRQAASLIDPSTHIALTSNLIFIVVTSIILSIVGTIIIEKIVAPKIGKYKKEEDLSKTEQYHVFELLDEQQELEKKKYENRGLRYALIVTVLVIGFFIYSLIPRLPASGMLLDLDEKIYLNQLFGDNSYFQDGFAYMVSLLFVFAGIAYGIGAKSVKNDKEIIEKASKNFSEIGSIFILMFVIAQFIAVFKKTNIGPVIAASLSNLIETMNFSGIPLILISLIFIALANIFLTGTASKWLIFSPVVVPMFMQSNISPQFAQVVMRAGDSMTKGITPLLASFAIYIGYLNVYNLQKERPYTIRKSLKIITPYCLLIAATWIIIVVGWYLIGLPIGPGVFPTL